MPISVYEAHDIELHAPKMTVDQKWEVLPPLPDQAFSALICGPPRSGKTSLVHSLVTQTNPSLLRGVFDRVVLIIPEASFRSLPASSPFAKHKRVVHTFDAETLAHLVEYLEETTKTKLQSLIIIDDFMSNLKDADTRLALERITANRRHLRVSLMLISQNLRSVPLSVRKLVSHLFMFRAVNSKELSIVHEEYLSGLSKSQIGELVNYVWPLAAHHEEAAHHTFLYVDLDRAAVHRNFDELAIG